VRRTDFSYELPEELIAQQPLDERSASRLLTLDGATEGVLVVQAPENAAFKLEDGDVIQAIDGRKPDDGAHALRILRSYKSGEKLTLSVLRQRKPLSLAVTMPDRPEWEDHFALPPEPPGTAVPAVPPPPGMQDGA
jgi:S-adenosylmethionine:tRNA-ribosyltransferase-isomerase (queuine synthetase)